MIEFRDQYAKEHGWNLIVGNNMELLIAEVGPFLRMAAKCIQI
mgnify:CR=1 FL=1